jgi:hypothetical protein
MVEMDIVTNEEEQQVSLLLKSYTLYKATLIITTLLREFTSSVVGFDPGVKAVKNVGYNNRGIIKVIELNMHVRYFFVPGSIITAEYLSRKVGIARSSWE